MQSRRKREAGFSLVEVSLAMMIISLGMITLFGLFPASMKQGEEAYQDTQTAQFAEYVLNGIRANFDEAPDHDDWRNQNYCLQFLRDTSLYEPTLRATFGRDSWVGPPEVVVFPRGSETSVRYILELELPGWTNAGETWMTWRVALWAWSGEYGPSDPAIHKQRSQWFATEIFYGGMQ